MEKAIKAAIDGPETKKIKIRESSTSSKSHEFNVKPVSISVDHEGEFNVFGQISHCLRGRKDDQHWYGFKKKGNTLVPEDPKKMILEKKEGGLAATIDFFRPLGVAVGAYFGVDANRYFDIINENSASIGFLDMDSGYEKSIQNFLLELSKEIRAPRWVKQEGLTMFEHDNFGGKNVFFEVNNNTKDLRPMKWNDRISSLRATVPKNMKLEVFNGLNFSLEKIEFGPGFHIIRDLKIHKLGDKLSSIRWSRL